MEIDESFIRQRRNLLIATIVVFLINFAGIEIPHEIVISGSKYKIADTVIINMFIWAMLYYFLLRYFQVFFLVNSKYKDYGFIIYKWGDYELRSTGLFRNLNSYSILILGWETIKFLMLNASNIITVSIKSIFNINFTETLLPILLATFVIIASWHTPYYKGLKPEMDKRIEKSKNVITDEIYNKPLLIVENTIKLQKLDINEFLGIELFDIPTEKNKKNFNYFKN